MKNVSALYQNFDTAQHVMDALVEAGIPRTDISVVANDASGNYAAQLQPAHTQDAVTAGQGAGFGAVVGAVVGVGALLIPGIGPVVAAGPLVAGLLSAGVGAAAGAVTGGITAAIVHTGVDEQTANYYAEGVRRGGTLVSAQVDNTNYDQVVSIMNSYKPVDVTTQASDWRAGGWTGFNEAGEPYSSTTYQSQTETTTTAYSGGSYQGERPVYPAYDTFSTDFRQNYDTTYLVGGTPYTFERFDPAYRYGYTLATDPQYRDYSWSQLEPVAQRDWNNRHSDSPWQDFKDAVRYGWERVKAAF